MFLELEVGTGVTLKLSAVARMLAPPSAWGEPGGAPTERRARGLRSGGGAALAGAVAAGEKVPHQRAAPSISRLSVPNGGEIRTNFYKNGLPWLPNQPRKMLVETKPSTLTTPRRGSLRGHRCGAVGGRTRPLPSLTGVLLRSSVLSPPRQTGCCRFLGGRDSHSEIPGARPRPCPWAFTVALPATVASTEPG